MTKAMMLVRHPARTWRDLLAQPQDRSELVRQTVAATGASLEAMHFLVGDYDSCVILTAPDDSVMAAATLAMTAIGEFVDVKILTMLDPTQVPAMLTAGCKAMQAFATQ